MTVRVDRAVAIEIAVVVAIAAGIAAFFSPVWWSGRLFLSDGQYAAFFAPLANWSDAWIGGWAIGADTAQYVWYPVRWVALWGGLGFNGFVVGAYVIAALGTYAYLRVVGCVRAAAAFGGVSFALSGFMVAQLLHTSMIHAAAWVPWVFAGIEGVLARGERRWVVVGAAGVAMACLAGHMQIAFYGLVFASAYLLWRLPACRRTGRLRAWMLAGGSIGLGLLLAAPQLLMTIAYVRETPRALLDYESFVAFSLPWAQLPTLLFPFLFGSDHRALGTPYFGADNFAELCLYLPFLSLVLAVVGVGARRRRGIAGFWVAVACVAVLLALGGSVPGLAALVYRVPGFDQFRVPARHVMELSLAASVLAAFGMEWLARRPSRRALGWLVVGMVFAALAVVALSVPAQRAAAAAALPLRVRLPPWSSDPAIRYGLLGVLVAFVAVSALATGKRLGLVVFAAAAFVGLASFAWYADWRVARTGGAPQPTALERDIGARLAAGGGRVLHAESGWGAPFTAGRTRKFGMPSLNWYGPLLPLRARDLLQTTPNGVVALATLAATNTALDVYGTRYVAIGIAPGAANRTKTAALAPPRWQRVGREGDTAVYENTRALPLAWLTPAWREVPPEEALRLLQGGGVDPRAEALVESLPSGGSASVPGGTVTARWVDATRIAVDVESAADGFLVVSVNGVGGWTATVDGVTVPVHRADYALMGVPLAAGRHDVRFAFRTPAWQWAVPWSVVLLAFIALVRAGSDTERRQRATDRTSGALGN